MAATINHFGPVSEGIDRAQIGINPPVRKSVDARPKPGPGRLRRTSIHEIVSDHVPSLFAHPRREIRKIKAAIGERHTESPSISSTEGVPTLAPAPPASDDVRLDSEIVKQSSKPPMKDFVFRPVSTVKGLVAEQGGDQFAENVAKSEVPHGASVNIVVQDRENARARTAEEIEAGHTTLVQLKQLRQDAFVRWSIDRHVKEVRSVRVQDILNQHELAIEPNPKPYRSRWSNTQRELQRRIINNGHHYLDEPPEIDPPDREILVSSVERIVVASTPLQHLYMELRSISRWDNPSLTARYAVLYFLLLIPGYISSAVLAALLYQIWKRGTKPPTLDTLRQNLQHSEDRNQTPRHLSELITQYGTKGWIDHAIDRAGPAVHALLERFADILEMIQNFYEWRDPHRTTVSLSFLAVIWVAITILPTWIIVKVAFLSVGLDFFVLSPIGQHYPEYRLLLSPATWVLWKIPTHADWAMARLQAEGEQHILASKSHRQRDSNESSTMNCEPNVSEIGVYRCEHEPAGKLIVTTATISFVPRTSNHESWSFAMEDLYIMRKFTEPTQTSSVEGLKFVTRGESVYHVIGLKSRDEVFSQIIGYSDIRWKRMF